jgi:hypothetical protein
VWSVGIARVAEQRDHLPGTQPVADLDFDAAGLEVGVERVVAVAEVLHDVVSRILLERQTARARTGNLFG